MVIIDPRIDYESGTLHIKIPMHGKGEPDITITTPLDPTPDQLSGYELLQGISIWGVQVPSSIENPWKRKAVEFL